MHKTRQIRVAEQRKMVQALVENMRKNSGGSVKMVETHISWVLLAGRYAYKIKKAIDLGFLDFSTLQDRYDYCMEEMRLNGRLASKVYLKVIAIGGSTEVPVPGAEPAIEYAVKMRRFATSKQLDVLVARNKLLPAHIDKLAATIARFHLSLPAAASDSSYGSAQSVLHDAEQNFGQLRSLLTKQADLEVLAALHRASANEYAACREQIEQRRTQGFVRECHGDLHLGNIVLIDEQPIPFDGIEFNPALRWIDVISEVAFTVMDLLHSGQDEYAYRFLNGYLEITGDYAGIRVLRFYLAYRAMVRAKVHAIRASQSAKPEQVGGWQRCRGYLELAGKCFARKPAALIITHGLPGSGKTSFALLALERLPAIRLRSDVERKRLFGLSALADSHAATHLNLYVPDISKRTYARLLELATCLLEEGYTVIVDAAFLQQAERERFQQLAQQLSVPYAIASVQADPATLRARIKQRQRAENDASEADIAVLEKLTRTRQLLSAVETDRTVVFVNEQAGVAADSQAWERLQALLNS